MDRCNSSLRRYVRRKVKTITGESVPYGCEATKEAHHVKRKFQRTSVKTIRSPFKLPLFCPNSKTPVTNSTGNKYTKSSPNKTVVKPVSLPLSNEHYLLQKLHTSHTLQKPQVKPMDLVQMN